MNEKPHHLGDLIKRLNEIMEKNANKDLQDRGVTFAQMKMLIVLEQTDEHSLTLKELERVFGSTQATIAGTASRLEKKELVEGYIDEADRRIKHIRLTQKGLNLCNNSKHSMQKQEAWLVRMLDETEQEELMRLLMKIYDGMNVSCEENG